jgi:hypothetical protein
MKKFLLASLLVVVVGTAVAIEAVSWWAPPGQDPVEEAFRQRIARAHEQAGSAERAGADPDVVRALEAESLRAVLEWKAYLRERGAGQ